MPLREEESWQKYMAPQQFQSPMVPESTPITVTPQGGVVPSPNMNGLYAIYGRKNPYQAMADRYSRFAGMDMGGRLGQLPGIVAMYMSGKAQKKATEFEEQKESDVKSFMARKEAYDKIKTNREASKQIFDESTKVMGMAGDKFNQVLQETNGDFQAASAQTDEWLKATAESQGLPLAMMRGYARFKNSKVTFAISKDNKEWLPVQLDEKTGVALAWDKEKKTWGKIPEGYALISDYAKLQAANRPFGGGASPAGMLEFYDANGNLVAKTKDQAEAIKAGAVFAGRWVKAIDESGNETWKQEMVPLSKAKLPPVGLLNKPGAPAAMPTPPPKAQTVSTQFSRPVAVPGSPGSGQQPAALTSQPVVQPKEPLRMTDPQTGQIGLFDPDTKKFLRWEKLLAE